MLCFGIAVNIPIERLTFVKNEETDKIEEAMNIIAKNNYSRMVCLGEHGEALYAHTLPACRYWARQYKSTKAMEKDRERAIRAGIPDLVIIRDFGVSEGEFHSMKQTLEECGYKPCYKYKTDDYNNWLYVKKY